MPLKPTTHKPYPSRVQAPCINNPDKNKLYGRRWKAASKAFICGKNCVLCEREGRITPATVTDHIRPHKGNHSLFWDRSNWQPLCERCHNRKTATTDGGFGRKAKGAPDDNGTENRTSDQQRH